MIAYEILESTANFINTVGIFYKFFFLFLLILLLIIAIVHIKKPIKKER